MRQAGAIPNQIISELIDNGCIRTEAPIPDSNIQPASLDLRLGTQAWVVKAAFLPVRNEPIAHALDRYAIASLDLSNPTTLHVDQTYVVQLAESFSLPSTVNVYTNNKSSTGRMNVWVRTLVDGLPRFDLIPYGYQGHAYVMVTPRSWPIRVQAGCTLNQARLLVGDNHLLDLELNMLNDQVGLVFDQNGHRQTPIIDRGLLLTVNLAQDTVGYEAIPCSTPVDLTSTQPQNGSDYFRRIIAVNGEVTLKKHRFYILSTKEYLRVPPTYAVEMVAYDIHSGEYRSHYAGFFDPGFGYGLQGELQGTPAVLELDTHEDVVFRDGQPICKMVYEYLVKQPEKTYGQGLGSHYQNQRGPQLGKNFTLPED